MLFTQKIWFEPLKPLHGIWNLLTTPFLTISVFIPIWQSNSDYRCFQKGEIIAIWTCFSNFIFLFFTKWLLLLLWCTTECLKWVASRRLRFCIKVWNVIPFKVIIARSLSLTTLILLPFDMLDKSFCTNRFIQLLENLSCYSSELLPLLLPTLLLLCVTPSL